MKRSYTYLKGLLTLALAAFTGWMWAADPVATWTDFNTLTSGDYTLSIEENPTITDGALTLNNKGAYVAVSGTVASNKTISVVAEITTPADLASSTIVALMIGTNSANAYYNKDDGKIHLRWGEGLSTVQAGTFGNFEWTPGKRETWVLTYTSGEGVRIYIDGVEKKHASGLKASGTNLTGFYVGQFNDTTMQTPTGMTVHSLRIYSTKLSAEEVAFPSLAWTVPFNGANTTTGWVTSWGGESGASYVTTPNGQGYEVKNGCHPWVDYTFAKPSTVALYADISKVAEPASNSNGAIMVAFGKPGSAGENTGNLVLAKKASDTVVVTRSGAILASIKDADLALEGSYHLFVFGMNAEGKVFLSIDGAYVESENTTTLPANGLQIGSMFTGVGSYTQGYNMVVDEVRGYNAYLGSEDLAKLVAKFPEYKPQIASVTLEADAAYSTLNLAEGDTVNATITLKDGVTLDMDKAPTCAMLTIISEGTATVTTSVAAPFANVGGLTLNGNAVTIPAQLPEAMTMNATTITLEGGTAEAPQEISLTIAIASGKTLKTKGYLNFTAANTIAGTLEVVSGETTFNLAGTGLNGTVKVAAGATFKNGTNDGPNYNGAPTFDIAGTLEVTGTARWSLPANTTTTLRDGAILKGPGGTGYAYAYDYFNGATINVLGDATIEGNIGAHSPGDNGKIVFNIAEGKTLTLKGKYDGGVYGGQPTPPLQVTGAGTLKLENANTHAGTTVDTGAKIEVANASALPGAITNNGTITYTIDATPTNTLSGAGVTGVDAATLNMLSANLEGYTGSFAVANNGILILPAGKEKGVTVAAGSTLKLALSDTDKAGGYTSKATINEGGIFAFVEADGSTPVTEGVNGGTYTPSLPKWTPTSAESSWDDVACWSTESVPTSGDVIVDASELDADIALEISTSTTLGMVTIRSYEGRKVVFSLADGASVASVAALGDLELPLAIVNDTEVAVSVADGKKLYVNVAEDAELTKAIIIDGTVVKQGAAKLTLKKSIFAGDGVTIDAGTIAYSDGAIAGNDQEEEGRLTSYTDMGNILVKNGATLDFNGSANSWTNTVMLDEGATLANDSTTDLGEGARQLRAIVLNGDATLRAKAKFSLTASSYAASTVTLNGHTLTKTGAASFVATNASISNGTFYLKEGRLDNSQGNISMASGITLKIDAGTTTSGAFTYQGDVAFDLADTVTMTTSAALSGNITKDGLGAWTISGVISGENSAVAVNAGTLTLSGANTRSANAITTIEKDATLVLSGESAKLYSDNFGGNQHGATLTIRGKLITGNWNYGYSLGGLRVNKPTVQIDGGTVEFTQSCNEGQDPRGFTVTANGATLVMPDGMTYSKANPADGSNGIACNGTLNLTGAGTYQFGGAVSGAVVVGTNTKLESGTFNTLTLADGATLAGAVTVTGDVTVEGALTITHATAAGDTVITCANAEAVAAALPTAPATLKYVADGNTIKLAVAKVTVALPAVSNAVWKDAEGNIITSITVDPNSSTSVKLETTGDYVFADGSTSMNVTIESGDADSEATAPADASIVAAKAKIGDKLYATLDAALTAAAEDDTITLLAGVTINSRLDIAQNVTIDLNGQTIAETMEDQFGAIYVKKGATLTIAATNGGEITTDGGIVIGNYGTVIVNGGTIAAGEDAETDVSIYNFYYQADWYGTTTINGGTVARIWNCGVATLADGEVTDVDNSGAMTITDATVTNIILRDGTDAPGIEGAGTLTAPEGLTVTTLDGQKAVYADGKYTVVDIVYVAQVGETKYETLQAAVEAGDTITLLADVEVASAGITITTDTTIDLAGKNITSDGDVFIVTGGTLTITGEGNITANTDNAGTACALWANGGNAVIDGGTWSCGGDTETTDVAHQNDTIYTKNGGKVTITGGTFEYTENVWTLNENDNNRGTISVKGGKFKTFNPANNTIEGAGTNFCAVGYTAVEGEGEDAGYYVVTEIVLEDELAGTPAAETIKEAMADAGVAEITDYIITTKGTPDDAATVADVAAVLEVFDVEPTVAEDGTLTVAYEFGISAMTNVGDTVTITAGVTGAEYRAGVEVAFYADDEVIDTATTTAGSTTVSITDISAEDINGKKITVKAIKQ